VKIPLSSLLLSGVLSLSLGCQPQTELPALQHRAEPLEGQVGTWTAIRPKTDGSPGLTAVVLRSTGEVLATNYGLVQRYDPYADTWRTTSPQCTPSYCTSRSLTELPSGEVFAEISGAQAGSSGLQKYNPDTNTWTALSGGSYQGESVTLLDSGNVLLAGGYYTTRDSSAYRVKESKEYNPAQDKFTASNTLLTPRSGHTATLLYSGQVLVTGGTADGGGALASAELYNPATKSWSPAGALSKPRTGHRALRLYSGTVMIFGDTDTTVDLYDPFNATWSVGPALPFSAPTAATLLYSGDVLVTNNAGQSAVYSANQKAWLPAASAASVKATGASVLLQTGQVLRFNGGTTAAELFSP
jgi:hypothetical protein